jgi:hypothetical protein
MCPKPSDTVGQVKERAAEALGICQDKVALQDRAGRRLYKDGATIDEYGAKLPVLGFVPLLLPGGMPAKKQGVCYFVGLCARDLCLCLFL